MIEYLLLIIKIYNHNMNKLEKTLSLIERMNYVGKPYMLTESQESSSQKEAIRYVEQQLGWSHEKANNFVRVDDFKYGFAKVKLHGEDYKLDTSGRLHNMNENKRYKNMKQVIRLTESDLHRLIKESVKRILREGKEDEINASWDAYENTFDTYIDGTIPTKLDKDNFYPMYHNIGKDKYNTLKTKSEIDYPNEFSTDSKYFKGRNAMEAMDDRFPTTQQMRQNHWRGKAKDGRIN